MHWLTPKNKILVYDSHNNNVGCLSGPQRANASFTGLNVGVCRNSLGMSQLHGLGLRIQQLKDYNKMKWSLKHHLNLIRINRLPHWDREGRWSNINLIAIHYDDPDILYLSRNFQAKAEKKGDNGKKETDVEPYRFCISE
ncbi:conserved hypothetical protein [Ricinus communis]|uniref:Uncharacterized protein n=1 Tax=Ricinus communis TaxID=3988 RepID=B9SU20_RICCO|nr:conserved hypothetical protein [Ricinus communis]